ncbi:MAG TPA: glycoside hydrolase domain-containing protein, partial [Verrucomicrobiae bacterium]
DPLAPCSELELPPDYTQPLWFTVHAPKDAAPGVYRAEVGLSTGAGKPITIPLTVRVLPFALPDQGRLRAIFDLRFGPGGGFGSGIGSKEDRRKWLRFMAEHRLGIDSIEPPPKFGYEDGKVSMDAAEFDEMAHYCFDELGMNVAYTPQFFYLFGWAYPPKKLFGLEPFTPQWTDAFEQAYRLFSRHITEKGWHDKFVYYISDEPHFQHQFVVDQMKKLCALIHEVDSAIPIYSSTWRHCAAWDDSLDLWGIGQYGCFPVNEMEQLQKAGKQMWFTCDGQMATDTPYLATERMLPYYCFKYGVRGFEFWGFAWWTYNPWQVGWHQFIRQSDEGKKFYWVRYPDGDGFLAYPGKLVGIDGPVSTIRLEQVRQGLEDYEALALLADLAAQAKQAGAPSAEAERALAMARELVTIPNAGGLRSTEILPDPARVPAIRKAVNAALSR